MAKGSGKLPQSKDRHPKGSTMVRLPPDLRDKMSALAAANERTLAAEVRVAVRQYLERKQAEQESGS